MSTPFTQDRIHTELLDEQGVIHDRGKGTKVVKQRKEERRKD